MTTSRRPTRRWTHRVVLGIVFAAGVLLRVRYLDQPVRYDEAVTFLDYVARPLSRALATYDLPNNHLFHTLLAHLSVDLFGDRPRALRLPAFAAGVATLPAVWVVGRAWGDRWAGVVAAAVVAVSPAMILFSTNARGYSIVVLAFLLLARLAATLRVRPSPLAWGGFVAVMALGAWTIPVMLFPAGAVLTWLLLYGRPESGRGARPRRRSVVREAAAASIVAAGLTALLYLPVLRRAGLGAIVSNRFVEPRSVERFLGEMPAFLAAVWAEWTHGLPPWIAALLILGAAGAIAGMLTHRERGDAAGEQEVDGGAGDTGTGEAGGSLPSLFAVALVWSVGLLVLLRRTPFARVWLFLFPAFVLFSARGLRGVFERLVDRLGRDTGSAAPVGEPAGPTASADEPERPGGPAAVGGPGAFSGLAMGTLALLVTAVGGVGVVRSEVVVEWGVTGSLPAGDRIASFLAARWDRGDGIYAPMPSDGPLGFYFRREGIPPSAVNRPPRPGGCLYVVVNHRHGQTLGDVAPLLRGRERRAVLLHSVPGADVYGVLPEGAEGGRACGAGDARDPE